MSNIWRVVMLLLWVHKATVLSIENDSLTECKWNNDTLTRRNTPVRNTTIGTLDHQNDSTVVHTLESKCIGNTVETDASTHSVPLKRNKNKYPYMQEAIWILNVIQRYQCRSKLCNAYKNKTLYSINEFYLVHSLTLQADLSCHKNGAQSNATVQPQRNSTPRSTTYLQQALNMIDKYQCCNSFSCPGLKLKVLRTINMLNKLQKLTSMNNMTTIVEAPAMEDQLYDVVVGERIYKYTAPALISVGTIGNVLTVIVLLRKPFRHTTMCFYLICLTIMDTSILYIVVLPQYLSTFNLTTFSLLSDFSCKVSKFLVHYLSHVDSWIIVCVTSERFAAVFFPLRFKDWFTKCHAAVLLGFIVLLLAIVDVHFFWTFQLSYVLKTQKNNVTMVYLKCIPTLKEHVHFMRRIWVWIDMSLFSLMPFTIIIIANTAICIKLLKSHITRQQTTITQSQTTLRLTRTVIILIVISAVFITTTLPITVWHFLGIDYTVPHGYWAAPIRVGLVMLQYVNNTFNFALYCLTGSQFRMELVKMFRGEGNHPQQSYNAHGTATTQL